MLLEVALGLMNHLLTEADWARDRLKPFSGQTACLELGTLKLSLVVTPGGLFAASGRNAVAAVTIRLPADAPIRALIDRPSLFASAQISGSAELAENLGFVFRNLRWDAESDLSQMVGDIAAHRLVDGGMQLARWHQQQAKNLALNLAEYFTEENPTIARLQDVSAFCRDVYSLQAALDRLERRVVALER